MAVALRTEDWGNPLIYNDATRIRVIRATLGMNCRTFAGRLGISLGTLTNWERGRTGPRGDKRDALTVLCQEFGIGFTPSGFPFPTAEVLIFTPKELTDG